MPAPTAPFRTELHRAAPEAVDAANAREGRTGPAAFGRADDEVLAIDRGPPFTPAEIERWLAHPDERVTDALLATGDLWRHLPKGTNPRQALVEFLARKRAEAVVWSPLHERALAGLGWGMMILTDEDAERDGRPAPSPQVPTPAEHLAALAPWLEAASDADAVRPLLDFETTAVADRVAASFPRPDRAMLHALLEARHDDPIAARMEALLTNPDTNDLRVEWILEWVFTERGLKLGSGDRLADVALDAANARGLLPSQRMATRIGSHPRGALAVVQLQAVTTDHLHTLLDQVDRWPDLVLGGKRKLALATMARCTEADLSVLDRIARLTRSSAVWSRAAAHEGLPDYPDLHRAVIRHGSIWDRLRILETLDEDERDRLASEIAETDPDVLTDELARLPSFPATPLRWMLGCAPEAARPALFARLGPGEGRNTRRAR